MSDLNHTYPEEPEPYVFDTYVKQDTAELAAAVAVDQAAAGRVMRFCAVIFGTSQVRNDESKEE